MTKLSLKTNCKPYLLMVAIHSTCPVCATETIKLVTKVNLPQMSDANPIIQPNYCFQENNLKIWRLLWSSVFSVLLLA